MKKNPPKFLHKYFEHSGCVCPFCGKEGVQAGDNDFEGNYVWQNVSCDECGKEWTDQYRMDGICVEEDFYPKEDE